MSKKGSKSFGGAQNQTPMKPLEPVVVEPSAGFKAAVLEELRLWEKAKRDAHREPHHTMYCDFLHHLSDTLNALYKDGLITVGHTLNDKYILVNEQNLSPENE